MDIEKIENWKKEIIISKHGLTVIKDDKGLTVNYDGDLALNLKGSINLIVDGDVNLLGNGPINIDAPKTDETNHVISLNSRFNTNIKHLPSSITFRKKAEEKSREALEEVHKMIQDDGVDVPLLIKKASIHEVN